jgi:hypothetical protein
MVTDHRSEIEAGGGVGGKNRNGRTAFAVTAVPHMDRLESELAPPFFSLLATVWLIAVREGEERPQC